MISLSEIEVRLVTSAKEKSVWASLMDEHHYLKFSHLVGTSVCYIAHIHGAWLALLSWTWASYKNSCRDQWIGWSSTLKDKRLRFIVNNSRFLILPNHHIKNLASRVLSLNLKRLSSDWEQIYGHPLLLAETFVDPSRFQGTCYQASNWKMLGMTRGFARKGPHYVAHGIPKKVFVFPLQKKAPQHLKSDFFNPSLFSTKEPLLNIDLNDISLTDLMDYLSKIKEHRKARGIRHAFLSLLTLCVCASLCEAKGYTAISEWANSLPQGVLLKMGFRMGRAPSEPTIRRFIQALNPEEVDQIVSSWVLKHIPSAKKRIALDGKTLRGSYDEEKKSLQLLSAIVHQEGVVVAQRKIGDKTNEIPEVKNLLDPLDIEGSIVTADALHTQEETARYLVRDKKSDFVFTVKENQEKLKQELQSLDYEAFPPSA